MRTAAAGDFRPGQAPGSFVEVHEHGLGLILGQRNHPRTDRNGAARLELFQEVGFGPLDRRKVGKFAQVLANALEFPGGQLNLVFRLFVGLK